MQKAAGKKQQILEKYFLSGVLSLAIDLLPWQLFPQKKESLKLTANEREKEEKESQIYVRICYDLWVFATVAKSHFLIYGYQR